MRKLLELDKLTEALIDDMPSSNPEEPKTQGVEFINLTPHAITVLDLAGKEHTFPPSGTVARVNTSIDATTKIKGVDGDFKVTVQSFGAIQGLPPAKPGTAYIVSGMLLDKAGRTDDVVAPDTGPTAIRESGQIKAVRGFIGL